MGSRLQKGEVEESVLDLARARVATVFDRFDHVTVSFSGGKDSGVCAHLALEEARRRRADGRLPADYKLDMYFWDEEAIQPETIDFVARMAALPDVSLRWICAPIRHVNACSKREPYWYPWAPEKREVWCRPLPSGALVAEDLHDFRRLEHPEVVDCIYPRSDGRTVGVIVGVRADESMRRMNSVLFRAEDNWISYDGGARHLATCKVIYDWTTLDVWTAPHLLGWDWNRAYDVMARAGLSPNMQRVCHPFGQQALQQLWMWAVCWPNLFDRILGRVDGAATAYRYSRSPLYAAGGNQSKRADESYEDAITRELYRWAPEVRGEVAQRLRREIARHQRLHPGVAVPDVEPYVDLVKGVSSGVTWADLLKIATLGDLKSRVALHDNVSFGQINEMRALAWGPDWREVYPEIAARVVWDSRAMTRVTIEEAQERGIET